MTAPTLEQELEAVAAGTDYRITVSGGSYLYVRVHYIPSIRVGSDGKVVLNNGCIAHGCFGGSQRRRWRKATRLVRDTINGHRAMLVATGVKQV